MNRIKAFTILEMVINLAIMSIIIAMVYVVYGYFSKNISDYSKNLNENFEYQVFLSQMESDFFNSNKVFYVNDQAWNVVFYNNDTIYYYPKGKYLYRVKDNVKDSVIMTNIIITRLNNQSDKVKRVEVQTKLYGEPVSFLVLKTYFLNDLLDR